MNRICRLKSLRLNNRRFHWLLLLLTFAAGDYGTIFYTNAQNFEKSKKTYKNPIIDRIGPADPHVIKHEGKYYLYPTTDGRGYDVFVSDDLVHWEQKPKVFLHPNGGAWAPDVFYNKDGDGKFYLYYTVNAKPPPERGGKVIGVAVSSSPLGQFEDKGILIRDSIDAHLFKDDDGSYYLYYAELTGGFKIKVQPMANPLEKRGEAIVVIRPTEEWEKRSGAVTEGPFMLKRNGIYYLMYSGTGADSPNYGIGYATAKSPLGPFQKYKGNPIAHRTDKIFGPGHHSVIEGPDKRLWLVYHQKASTNTGWDRFIAIDPLWFDENGIINVKLSRGTDEPAP